ncbi:MAG: hypothetical protein QXF25_02080 [Candidatus Pacearchaeota archaeon]
MGRKVYSFFILFGLLLVSLVSICSADILFGQTNPNYNLNDLLKLKVIAKPTNELAGFLELNLNCEGEARNFYKEYVSLKANEEKEVSVAIPLTNQFVAKTGVCKIEGILNSEVSNSQEFNVSNKLTVQVSSNQIIVEPGREFSISGTAIKENDQKVDGFVNLYIDGTELNVTNTIKDGSFSVTLKMLQNIKSGSYILKVFVYEKINSEITNYGEAEINIKILSVPKMIDVAISSMNVNPGEKIVYKPIIYDQANDEINDKDVLIKIKNSNSQIISEKIVKSGEEDEVWLEETANPGNWEITANAVGLSATKTFYVAKVEKAEFVIENSSLIVINKGNVVYTKAIEVEINEQKEIVEVGGIEVGKTKKFRLFAPDGTYNVKVTDGINEIQAETLLTGKTISIRDSSEDLNFWRYILVWIFLFFVLGFFVYSTAEKIWSRSKKYNVKESRIESVTNDKEVKNLTAKSPTVSQLPTKKLSEIVLPRSANPEFAEHTLVLHGEKQESCLLTFNVKNPDKMKLFEEILDKITKKIIENKGVIYKTDNFLIGIFAPLITKTFKNEVQIVKLASEIKDILDEYNKKFKEKIAFGLAIHSGNLILEKTPEKLKFTSSDNTLSQAKKLSELANNEFIISESIYKKSGGEIKAKKEEREKLPIYIPQKIAEREDYSKFIRDFLNRNKEIFSKMHENE